VDRVAPVAGRPGSKETVGLFQKLFRRGGTYEQWLEEHPDKRRISDAAPTADPQAESERMRSQMEGELDAQREARGRE
jgi:hypothetical protein